MLLLLDHPSSPPRLLSLLRLAFPHHVVSPLLQADDVNKLVMVPGIVINCNKTQPKVTTAVVRCKTCGDEQILHLPPGLGGVAMPRVCRKS